MAKKQQYPYPLSKGQVLGTRSVDEGRVVWRGRDVGLLNRSLGLDGDEFTRETRAAVIEKQKKSRSLIVTGVVDQDTWNAIVP